MLVGKLALATLPSYDAADDALNLVSLGPGGVLCYVEFKFQEQLLSRCYECVKVMLMPLMPRNALGRLPLP